MKIKLTPSRIGRLRPKVREFTVWDSMTPHLGIRVMPTGAMRYIHLAQVDGRLRKSTIGDAERMPLEEARDASRKLDERPTEKTCSEPCQTLGEWVEWTWWPQATAHLKSNTKRGYRYMLDRQLLPAFGGKQLDGITRTAILTWYERYSRRSPGAANKALELLSSIFSRAKRGGVIGKNPARNIRELSNPRKDMQHSPFAEASGMVWTC